MDLGITQIKVPRTRFIGIIKDVFIAISRAEYKIPIWVAEGVNIEILLERPYFVQAKLKIDNKGDGSCIGEILFKNNTKVIRFQAVAVNIIENRTRDDLIRIGTLNAIAEV
jgi:hypothetical protein